MSVEIALTYELRMLAYSALLGLVLWIPYVVMVASTRGVPAAMGYPSGFVDDLPDWCKRAHRAHMNLIENLAPFAVLVLLAFVTGKSNDVTALGAALFFWSRLAHVIIMIAGIPYLRTLAFVVSWVGCLIIFWVVVT